MWKTGKAFRQSAFFYPQPGVHNICSIHRGCEEKMEGQKFHRNSFHISQGLWINKRAEKDRRRLHMHAYSFARNGLSPACAQGAKTLTDRR